MFHLVFAGDDDLLVLLEEALDEASVEGVEGGHVAGHGRGEGVLAVVELAVSLESPAWWFWCLNSLGWGVKEGRRAAERRAAPVPNIQYS